MQVKNIAVILGVIGAVAVVTQAGAAPILFNTGLGAQGAIDPNYTLVDGSGTVPLIQYPTGASMGNLIPTYWQSLPGAQWISPYIPGDNTDPWVSDIQGFTYIFQTIVGGSGTGLVSGTWDSDDATIMFVNGNPVAARGSWPAGLATFSVLLSAGDVVTFEVNNAPNSSGEFGNPDGLIVSVPEGGLSVALLGFALVGVEGLRRKLRR